MKNYINEELLYAFKSKKSSFLVVFLFSFIGILSIGLTLLMNIQTNEQVEEYKEIYEENQYYTILDNFLGDAAAEMEGKEGREKLQTFLKLLEESSYFNYYQMYAQPIYVADYKGKDENIYMYGYKSNLDEMTIKLVGTDGIVRNSTCVEGFWIGENVIQDFNLDLQDGRNFEPDDFILTTNDEIEVILGANYKDEYKVGDSIYVSFVFSEREAKVVGILEEGTNIYYDGRFVNLDRMVIMPVFENNVYNGKPVFTITNHFYTLRNSGVVVSKLSCEDVQRIIEEYSKKAGFTTYYYITEYDEVEKESFSMGVENIKLIIDILAIIIVVIAMVMLIIYYINKIQRNSKYYAILLMNGSNKREMFMMIQREIYSALLIAYIIVAIILINATTEAVIFGVPLLVALFIGTILFGSLPIIFIGIVFWKRDLIFFLKEEI